MFILFQENLENFVDIFEYGKLILKILKRCVSYKICFYGQNLAQGPTARHPGLVISVLGIGMGNTGVSETASLPWKDLLQGRNETVNTQVCHKAEYT